MILTETAPNFPSKCAVSGFSDGPFVDCEARLGAVDPHIYLNVEVAKEIGRFLGMVDAETHAERNEEVALLNQQLADMAQELDEAQAFVKAVHVLERHDVKPVKRKAAA